MNNGDKVKIINGDFGGYVGEVYISEFHPNSCEVYIEENNIHSGFYIYCTKDDIEPIE